MFRKYSILIPMFCEAVWWEMFLHADQKRSIKPVSASLKPMNMSHQIFIVVRSIQKDRIEDDHFGICS
jgi:hypothetical protein